MKEVSLRTDEIISQDLNHYGDMLLRLAYSYMKNIHDAEDAVQDVFIKLLKNIEIFESEDHKKHWIICVTRNICKNKLKSAWFKKNVELTDIPYYDEYKDSNILNQVIKLPLKTLPKGFKMESINVISNEIIQVEYDDGSNNIVFRAGKGIENISGDYNVYQVKNTAKVNGINVNLEGNKSEEYNLAVWEKDGISYSILAKNGIDEKTILDMILN